MNIMGYVKGDDDKLVSLSKISIIAEPYEMRVLAAFLLKEAEIRKGPAFSGGTHLRDEWRNPMREWTGPDIVLYVPDQKLEKDYALEEEAEFEVK